MHALDGLKVADFTTMINGPYAALMLSDMGAEVVKVEPPDGDPWRVMAGGFMAYNRGKRSLVVDLKKEAGREIARRLISRSDVVVENARWGVWHKLGLDYDSVRESNPNLVYLSSLGHGSRGPYRSLPGYDPLFQSRSGQMVGQGGRGKPPVFHRIALNDLGCPMLGAFGVALGLLARERTGKGQRVETSLTNASAALQAGEFLDYEGFIRPDLGGPDVLGLGALHRYYQTADDRWIFVMAHKENHFTSLCQGLGLENLASDARFATPEARAAHDADLADLLAGAIRGRTADESLAALARADVPAALGRTHDELFDDAHIRVNRLLDERDHPEHGRVRLIGVGPAFSDMTGVIRRPAPMLGQHTEEVLAELAYSSKEIARLLTDRVAFKAEPPAGNASEVS
jgi:formyl-CoA transferase